MRDKRLSKEKRKNKLIRMFGITAVLISILFIFAGLLVKSLITEEFLTEEIESSINASVKIGNASVSIFSFPAKISLSDVVLLPKKDDQSNDAKIEVERVELRVSIISLLANELNVTSINVFGADITTTYREDGSTSIEGLFSKNKDADLHNESADKGLSNKENAGGFNACDRKNFVTTLGRLTIERSRARILLEEMGVRLLCTNLNAELAEMRIDPDRLQETDKARLRLSVDVQADAVDGWAYGEMYLAGDASARIFNQNTGELEPEIEGDFSLSKESWLNTQVPLIKNAWGVLGALEKVGVKVSKLPKRATFGRSEAIALRFHLGKLSVHKPLSIWVGDWELAALSGSWLNTETDLHELNAELLASESVSRKSYSVIEAGVDFIPKRARETVVESVVSKLFRDDRLVVAIKSTGEFSEPKIRLSGEMPDLVDEAKKEASKLLKSKAKGLLDGLLR